MNEKFRRVIKIIGISLTVIVIIVLCFVSIVLYINNKDEKEWKEYHQAVQDSLSSEDPFIRDACAFNQLRKDYKINDEVILAIEKSDNPELIYEGAKNMHRHGVFNYSSNREKAKEDAYKMAYLYMLAAEKGHPTAQAMFSQCLMKGFGTSCNYEEAYYWAYKSAEADDEVGLYALGICLVKGYGTKRNKELGLQLLRESANRGYEKAKQDLLKNL